MTPSSGPPLVTRALILVCLTLLFGAMVPNLFVLAPRFLHQRGYDERDVGAIMGAYNIASLVGMPAIAWLVARLGYARTLAAGCLVAAAGAIAFDAGETLPAFAVARGLMGLGFTAVLVGGAAYAAEIAPPGRLGETLGVAGVLTLSAQALGPVLGRGVLALASWPWVFRTGIACGAIGAAVALTLPAVPARARDEGDATGGAWLALGATALAGLGFGALWTFLADYAPRAGVDEPTTFFVPYTIAAVGTRLGLGGLSDRVGRHRAAIPALGGHVLALIVVAELAHPWQLALAGLGYGLCHGIYYPTLQALVVERAGGHPGRAITVSTFAFGLGAVAAAYGLGPIARAHGYPLIYALAAAAGALAALALVLDRALQPAPR